MHRSVYADNFRGFRNCLLSLEQVNFLVGENSSGKSSFLALAHLVFCEDFWAKLDFNVGGHDLGGFSDVVSKVTDEASSFSVGCSRLSEDENVSPFAVVVTLRRDEEACIPLRCTYLHGKRAITYEIRASRCRWTDHGETNYSGATELLASLVQLHQSFRSKQAKVLSGIRLPRRYVLMLMPFHIQTALGKSASASGFSGQLMPQDPLPEGAWFAPIRAEPRRFYQSSSSYDFSPAGLHTPYLLKDLLRRRKGKKTSSSVESMLKLFGEESGLFERISVRDFGSDPAAPFSVSVSLEGTDFHVGEVGYGVSQVLPLVAEMLATPYREGFFIQQPEVHLHPRAQAAIANILYMFAIRVKETPLVVETHSDFVIDRFRTLIREKYLDRESPIPSCLLWFERSGGENRVFKIMIDNAGEISGEVPSGYREFFLNEGLRGLGLDVDP